MSVGLYELFASSCATHPENVALEVDGVTVSYAELSRLVDRIATALEPDGAPARFGLHATPHTLTYAGYLAALRIGATVVPLDPEAPAHRLAQIAHAAGLTTVLSADPVRKAQGLRVVDLRACATAEAETGPDRALVPVPSDADRTAYILFTSGSTGRPKGVPISHRNAVAYVTYSARRYEVTQASRLSQTFDLTFDPSVFDLFTGWSAGAAVVVPRKRDLLMPAKFVETHRITHWFSVPSVVSVAARLGTIPPGSMPGLRCSQFIGEQLTLKQAEAWSRAAPHSHIENVYGPTELTVACAEYRLPRSFDSWPATSNGTVPIGRIYPHLEYVVVDDELCIRGVQRFGGYLDPQDNAGRFLSFEGSGPARVYDGTEELSDAHWYRTGDRVRIEHGQLVHHGRDDHQVKIQGYRIELGEIEAALLSHEAVREAVVACVDRGDSLIEIRAVLTGTETPPEVLEAYLAHRLPKYMVPRAFYFVPEMPLGGNRKLDRREIGRIAAGPQR